ncbi:MAG TPA: C4-type zinc ribbon domain-containing protein [Dehalococcoidia bacterium]|nr:C4-type zinc ribbon domain-containing protein [Dehalococcoidia bacterium]
MSLSGQLYKLQQLDIELQKKQQLADEITHQLNETSALVAAQSELASQKQQLEETKKKQQDTEWELEDLQQKIKDIDNKLYGGAIKNPKELVNLKHESESFKGKLSTKEDELLELMSQVEEMEAKVTASTKELEGLQQEWQQKQETLTQAKAKTEATLASLKENRQELAQQIDSRSLNLYEQIKLTKGQAVAKVEQGRCQGCHITLPINQWRKAKAGNLVQCSSCNRILYVE